MSYAELYPALITKNLVQPRPRPPVPEVLPWWYKPEVSCPFHQNAPGHDLDNCFALKLEVQKLTRAGILTFKNMDPNVKDNPMPSHGPSSVKFILFYVLMVYSNMTTRSVVHVQSIQEVVERFKMICKASLIRVWFRFLDKWVLQNHKNKRWMSSFLASTFQRKSR